MAENEIELISYLNVIWKRKWLIIIPTFLLAVIAGVISFLLPRIWMADAVVLPSKSYSLTESGQLNKAVFVDPKQIEEQINTASYNNIIASELGLDVEEFPELKAEHKKETNLVHISVRDKNIERAKSVLNSLINHLKEEIDTKVNIEIKEIDSPMSSNEIQKLRIRIF